MRGAASACLLAGLAGVAAGASGKVVRVEAPPRLTVHIAAGWFAMGVDDDSAVEAQKQCSRSYPVFRGLVPNTGAEIDFCADYRAMLDAMAPRQVYLDAFEIDRDEVSVDEYRACIAAGSCQLDAFIAGDERYIRDGWPMVNVTWGEASDYCAWRGGALPTEAQWERAAKGAVTNAVYTWPWGATEHPNDFNHGQARAEAMQDIVRSPPFSPDKYFGDPDDSDGVMLLAPRGSYPWGESPEGVRDMAGNVAEWTADAFVGDDQVKGYEQLSAINPFRVGRPTDQRVVRGGSWREPAWLGQSNLRDPSVLTTLISTSGIYQMGARFSHVGFRCARKA